MSDTLTHIQLEIPEDAWKPVGGTDTLAPNDHKLLASVVINGTTTLYLEAFELQYNEDATEHSQEPHPAMGEGFEGQFRDAAEVFYTDGALQVMMIKGRPYAVYGCPGAE